MVREARAHRPSAPLNAKARCPRNLCVEGAPEGASYTSHDHRGWSSAGGCQRGEEGNLRQHGDGNVYLKQCHVICGLTKANHAAATKP